MAPISRARLARIEKVLAADLDAARRVARLEKIAMDESQHPARRARANDEIWAAWRKAALATPSKAAVFWERARLAAVAAEALRPNVVAIIRARLKAVMSGEPTPPCVAGPDAKLDPNNPAACELRGRLTRLANTHSNKLG